MYFVCFFSTSYIFSFHQIVRLDLVLHLLIVNKCICDVHANSSNICTIRQLKINCDKGITGGKEVEFTSLSGRIPEQKLVQK